MNRTLDIAAIAFAAFFLLALAVVSSLGMLNPQRAAVGYGMPVTDAAGALFYRVFASRNLVLVAAAVIYLLMRLWTPLAILVTLTSALAAFDMGVLTSAGAAPPAFHAITLVFILITSALLWRRALAAR
jgi:uncharacterized protein DUF4267